MRKLLFSVPVVAALALVACTPGQAKASWLSQAVHAALDPGYGAYDAPGYGYSYYPGTYGYSYPGYSDGFYAGPVYGYSYRPYGYVPAYRYGWGGYRPYGYGYGYPGYRYGGHRHWRR